MLGLLETQESKKTQRRHCLRHVGVVGQKRKPRAYETITRLRRTPDFTLAFRELRQLPPCFPALLSPRGAGADPNPRA